MPAGDPRRARRTQRRRAAAPAGRPHAAGRAPEALKRTEPAKDRPAGEWAQQPFQPAPPRPPPSGRGVAGTLQLREMGLGTGETATLGDTAIARALAVLPFAPSTAGVVSFPDLTPQQYASLRAELAVAPGRPGAILPRYGVWSEAARRALDAWWEAHLAAQPAVRAAFEKDLATFTAWLRGERT
jgi:hypothetical protein